MPAFQPLVTLIAVDVQGAFVTNDEGRRIAQRIEALQPYFAIVVATQFANTERSLYRSALAWEGCSTAQDQAFAFKPLARSRLVRKTTYAVSAHTLRTTLPKAPSEVVLCGFNTEACVLATAFACFDAGYRPFIVSDLCASAGGEDMHRGALEIARLSFGADAVLTEAELRSSLSTINGSANGRRALSGT